MKKATHPVSSCKVEFLYLDDYEENLHYISLYSPQPQQLNADEVAGIISWTEKTDLTDDFILNKIETPFNYTYTVLIYLYYVLINRFDYTILRKDRV